MEADISFESKVLAEQQLPSLSSELVEQLRDYDVDAPEGERTVSLSAEQARFLSEVQVSIGVEVGELSLSAEQLLDLLPGQSFEFAFDPSKPVSLHVGGEKVADAKFVADEGGLFLEILPEAQNHSSPVGNNLSETVDKTSEDLFLGDET